MVQGWFQVSQTSFSQILSASSPHKVFESLCFSASVNFKAFFDEYFVVKSHSCVLKFLIEFIDVSKTGLESKIRTPWAEIFEFFWDKVRRNSIFLTIEDFKARFIDSLESLHRNLSEK
jgi:hypothetical protein